MKTICLFLLGLFISFGLKANNIQISNITYTNNDITFDVSWENSWRATFAHRDAVWLFVKQSPNGSPSWSHGNIATASATGDYTTSIEDNVGVMLFKSTNNSFGTSSTTITLTLSNPLGVYRDIKVFGIEMVYVPQGPFKAGDGWSANTLAKGNDPSLPYEVTSENAMTHGTGANDYQGGFYGGNIPAAFPKGYGAFFCMKQQISCGQYVDFLNTLDRSAQDTLTMSDLTVTPFERIYVMTKSIYMQYRNPIRCDYNIGTGPITFYCDFDDDGIPNEPNDGQSLVMHRLSFHSHLAYLDWAGLAPMTTLEFEKAVRGPLDPVAGEFGWGSRTTNVAGTVINEGEASEKFTNSGTTPGIIVPITDLGECYRVAANAPASGGNRELSNATYYGILGVSFFTDIVIPLNQPNYSGQHGDGSITLGREDSFGDISQIQLKSQTYYGNNSLFSTVSATTQLVTNQKIFAYAGRGIRRM